MKRALPVGFLVVVAAVTGLPVGAHGECLPMLESVDEFVARQMDKFGQGLPQTYDTDNPDSEAYVYDASVAAIYLMRRGHLDRARVICNTFMALEDSDPIGDGRIRDCYSTSDLSMRWKGTGTGNMAWVGMSLARFYDETAEEKYLTAAKEKAAWINAHCKQNDAYGGFSLGIGDNEQPSDPCGRSVEHNVGVYCLAKGLSWLDLDPVGRTDWQTMADHAAAFVAKMYDPGEGKYYLGTHNVGGNCEINWWPFAADCHAWTALSGIDDPARLRAAMKYLVGNLVVTDDIGDVIPGDPRKYKGVVFSTGGEHIQCEVTGSAVLVPYAAEDDGWAQGEPWEGALKALLDHEQCPEEDWGGLNQIRCGAPGADPEGIGIVATPWPGGAPTGLGWDYPNQRHLASTAWTGLAWLTANGDEWGNPLRPLPEPCTLLLVAGGIAIVVGARRWPS